MNRLLVITDDASQLQAIENLLLNHDLRVTGATSLEQGLALVGTRSLDLVIVVMPLAEDSALDALKSIFELEPRIPTIVLTSAGNTEEAITATKAGAFDYVQKPARFEELVDKLEAARHRKAEHEERIRRAEARILVRHSGDV